MFEYPNLSRYNYKICGIKSATYRCKYNVSIPVEVELKSSYNIYIVCIKTQRHPKRWFIKMFFYSRQNIYNLNKKSLFNFWKVKLKRRNLHISGISLPRSNHRYTGITNTKQSNFIHCDEAYIRWLTYEFVFIVTFLS